MRLSACLLAVKQKTPNLWVQRAREPGDRLEDYLGEPLVLEHADLLCELAALDAEHRSRRRYAAHGMVPRHGLISVPTTDVAC